MVRVLAILICCLLVLVVIVGWVVLSPLRHVGVSSDFSAALAGGYDLVRCNSSDISISKNGVQLIPPSVQEVFFSRDFIAGARTGVDGTAYFLIDVGHNRWIAETDAAQYRSWISDRAAEKYVKSSDGKVTAIAAQSR